MLLVVPGQDKEPWPTLGPAICDLIEDRFVYGPGSLQGQPYRIDDEFRAWIYRCYEVYPRTVTKAFVSAGLRVRDKHPLAGRRRFKRAGMSVRKGLAKTEKEAVIVGAELHPEGPVRCDGFDSHGNPVGRPVTAPYIPMLAVTVDQVEELAYGALKYILENSHDADLFDITEERIVRLDEYGREDGKALPLANAPGARDGARTTLNAFDEPHRLYLPRQVQAHNTMDANLPKRPLEDPWSLYVGTAGQPGQGSVAESLHTEAKQIADGRLTEPKLFYVCRWAGGSYDLKDREQRIEAIREATGPAGEWGPGQFADIADQWDRPGADLGYLERVWLNRWRRSNSQAFDITKVTALSKPGQVIPPGAFCTLGFDGARFRDSTGFVLTDITTGLQQLVGGWEKPEDWPDSEPWEIDEAEVTTTLEHILATWDVWRLYGDPPHWTETMGSWATNHPDQIEEWWTNRLKAMAYTLREYVEAIDSGSIGYGGTEEQNADLLRHIGNAGRKDLKMLDDEGMPLWVLQKPDGNQTFKFDFAMASVLSWKARLDAVKSGAKPRRKKARAPRRIR